MASSEEQPKVKLYWLEKSRSQSTLWLLEELGVAYDLETFHRQPDMRAPPALKDVHPLGKSPTVTVTPAGGAAEPIVLAESGFITQYLSEHFGRETTTMLPRRWKEGQENKVGGETEAWRRWQYLLHFTEGSFMSLMMIAMVVGMMKGKQVPFFIRPVTGLVADQVLASFVLPGLKRQLGFLEEQLSTSGGDYLCGPELTSADVLLSFPLVSLRDNAKSLGDWSPAQLYPGVMGYVDRLEGLPGYKRAVEKIKAVDASLGVKF